MHPESVGSALIFRDLAQCVSLNLRDHANSSREFEQVFHDSAKFRNEPLNRKNLQASIVQ